MNAGWMGLHICLTRAGPACQLSGRHRPAASLPRFPRPAPPTVHSPGGFVVSASYVGLVIQPTQRFPLLPYPAKPLTETGFHHLLFLLPPLFFFGSRERKPHNCLFALCDEEGFSYLGEECWRKGRFSLRLWVGVWFHVFLKYPTFFLRPLVNIPQARIKVDINPPSEE